MPDNFLKLVEHLTLNEYQQLAGIDWPSFETIKTGKNIPQSIVDELTQMLVLPTPAVINVNYVEFYITNVCNMTCSDCRSFNNFNYKGHYEFDQELYQNWANRADIESYNILGGEPLLHPNLTAWVEGTRRLWPRALAKIDTNGTHIAKVKNLHQLLVDNQYFITINMHNPSKRETVLGDIKTTFGECEEVGYLDPRIHYNRTDPVALSNRSETSTYLLSALGLTIEIRPTTIFQKTPASSTDWLRLQSNPGDINAIYIGDMQAAHDTCVGKTCHVVRDGKLYKCAFVATLPEFLKQKNIQWPDSRLDQYDPLTVDTFSYNEYMNLQNPIPQCAFCQSGTSDTVNISLADIKKKKNVLL